MCACVYARETERDLTPRRGVPQAARAALPAGPAWGWAWSAALFHADKSIYPYECAEMYIYMSSYKDVCIYIYLYIHMYMYTFLYIYIHVYSYINLYKILYQCIYMYIH